MYTIVSDSSCDVSPEIFEEWGVKHANLNVIFEGTNEVISNDDMDISDFYKRVRAGEISKTSAVNPGDFIDVFEPELKAGRDILYIGFDSSLSNTYYSGEAAAVELREKYPDRKIITIDTLCASGGEGLIVYLAVKKRDEGLGIEEVAQYVRDNMASICHWIAIDDLKYLVRGGRVSATAAVAAAVLSIKPVIHVDDEGKLESALKVRGRKKSIQAVADKYMQLAIDPKAEYFICHADCLEDAKYLEKLIVDAGGAPAAFLTYMGPVIGSHAGPGTVAAFFVGKKR